MNSYEKFNQTTESIILFSALVGIVLISGIGVMSLNPRLGQKLNPDVAGINSINNKNELAFNLNHSGTGFSLVNQSLESQNVVTIRINKLERGLNEFEIGSIYNLNDFSEKNLEVRGTVKGSVQNEIQVSLFDLINTYTLYSPIENITATNLVLKESENKQITLQIKSSMNINFPFEIILEIK